MTQEEKYINFVLNYNRKLKERNTNWLAPDDLGQVMVETAEQNDPGCINAILKDIQNVADDAKRHG